MVNASRPAILQRPRPSDWRGPLTDTLALEGKSSMREVTGSRCEVLEPWRWLVKDHDGSPDPSHREEWEDVVRLGPERPGGWYAEDGCRP